MSASRPTQLVFPIVVWGDQYVETFLSLALRTFLAPENLPYCAMEVPTRLIILTTSDSAEKVRHSPVVEYAMSVCDVEIRPCITPAMLSAGNKYSVMASLHHVVLKELQGTNSVFGVLSPDCIISQACLKTALLRILEGYQAVLVAGPRAALQPFKIMFGAPGGGNYRYLALASRKIVTALCENFHPISKSVVFSSRIFTTMPSCLYWFASPKSFIARYFHLHPLLVRISPEMQFPDQHTGTVDSTLLDDTDVLAKRCYVCENSDEMTIVELTDADAMHIPSKRRWLKSLFVYRWSKKWANARQVQNFLTYTFLFKGADDNFELPQARANRDTAILRCLLRTRLISGLR